MSWCTIESDPGVFTELISKIGVNGVIVEEVYSLDMVPTANPCHGLIFLFEWQKSEQKDTRPVIDPSNLPDVFFARQTVSNACATQAILSILLNRSDVDLSPDLLTFKEFAMAMPADVRGDMIGQQDLIRTVHNSFSHPDPFEIEGPSTGKKGKVYHFVAYVPINGKLYELDGLKPGPILLNDNINDDNWLSSAQLAIQDRINRFSQSNDTHYALLSIVPDPLEELQAKVLSLQDEDPLLLQEAEAELKEYERKISSWKEENKLRRHNFFPFIIQLCKELASTGKLQELVTVGETQTQRRREIAAQRKADRDKNKINNNNNNNNKGGNTSTTTTDASATTTNTTNTANTNTTSPNNNNDTSMKDTDDTSK